MVTSLGVPELDAAQFNQISKLLYTTSGISLPAGKEGLSKARLTRRLRALGLPGFEQYVEYVRRDQSGAELTAMIDALTTNKTSFFRVVAHFHYLRQDVLPALQASGDGMRLWSAGCSSGEEPYSLAMLLREGLPDVDRRDVRILATDISTDVLAEAKQGLYDEEKVRDVPVAMARKYLSLVPGAGTSRVYGVNDAVRRLVHVARLNLLEEWPMRGPMDAIFCRNVMIYFDRATREKLVQRYWELLRPGGLFFVGLSESLTALNHQFEYVQPAVYVKPAGSARPA